MNEGTEGGVIISKVVGEMAEGAKWQDEKMAKWQDGKMAKWQNERNLYLFHRGICVFY